MENKNIIPHGRKSIGNLEIRLSSYDHNTFFITIMDDKGFVVELDECEISDLQEQLIRFQDFIKAFKNYKR